MNYNLTLPVSTKKKLEEIRDAMDTQMPLSVALRMALARLTNVDKKEKTTQYMIELNAKMLEQLNFFVEESGRTKKELLILAIENFWRQNSENN